MMDRQGSGSVLLTVMSNASGLRPAGSQARL